MRAFLSIMVLWLALLLEANPTTFLGITTQEGTTSIKIRVSAYCKLYMFFFFFQRELKGLTFQPQEDFYINIVEAIVGAILSPLISIRELIKKLTVPDYETNVRLYLNGTDFLHLLIVPGAIEMKED